MRSNKKVNGMLRHNARRKVVSLRDKHQQSWAEIGEALDIAPRTVRRLYDEAKGEGAHHHYLPGKGGRRVQQDTSES